MELPKGFLPEKKKYLTDFKNGQRMVNQQIAAERKGFNQAIDLMDKDLPSNIVDLDKVDDSILEKVFQRGYAHGVSGGMSDDGESYAVHDAKAELKRGE